jgi:AraC family transcriptional regulator, regulatory protein of adaptative response / DNA-3-methyladenine glycosylase II
VEPLRLDFEPPLDAELLLGFLAPRALPGIEEVEGRAYRRPREGVELHIDEHAVTVFGSSPLEGEGARQDRWGGIVDRARSLLDLDADPDAIGRSLRGDPLLADLVARHPGVRVPGAFDGFEVAVRAVLGQQVSVAGATTLAGRLIRAYEGFPSAAALAEADLEGVGLTRARASALRALGRAVADGIVRLEPGADAAALLELPGIGPWTAAYVGMRALRDPDAIPLSDLGLRRALERLGVDTRPAAVAARAEGWRPYRAYAAMHLWTTLSE